MPNVILKDTKTVWVDPDPFQIPNGPTIWNIKLEIDGQRELYKTMSKVMASEDFVGDVEVYTNDKGNTYVRQAPKEQSASSGYVPYKDNSSITLGMVWKTVAGIRGLPENPEDFAKFFEIVGEHTTELILMAEKLKESEGASG